jgi:alpha-L-fucosidase
VSHGADKTGPLAGVPYDGADPKFADLYHDADCARFGDKLDWNDDGIPESWKRHYLDRMTDLIDKYQPDFLYTDGHLPFEDYGLKMVSRLYNVSAQLHGGVCEAVYTSKEDSDCAIGTCLLDHERGVADGIAKNPWETDTCIGQWHYMRGQQYKTAKKVIDLLADIVSKNGNLLLNIPQRADGTIDDECRFVLDRMARWIAANAEGIYGTRPWHHAAEGPSRVVVDHFKEEPVSWTVEDYRFTTKDGDVYAFQLKWPEGGKAVIRAFAEGNGPRVAAVHLLGSEAPLQFEQTNRGLVLDLPQQKPCDYVQCYRVQFD